jgi:hypothetical protein
MRALRALVLSLALSGLLSGCYYYSGFGYGYGPPSGPSYAYAPPAGPSYGYAYGPSFSLGFGYLGSACCYGGGYGGGYHQRWGGGY